MAGRLLVVATPIGNLEDLSPRARAELGSADIIACEDTRRTGRLLATLGLKKRLLSLHDHNERARVPQIGEKLSAGLTVALVSDAGTPLLSDPGFLVVKEALARQAEVLSLPGPSAVLTSLVLSGLPPYPFTFLGFPPAKSGKRRTFFRRFAQLEHTLVLFESPHRIVASLEDLLNELGDRPAAVSREMTKLHEETLRGSLGEVLAELAGRPALKGEFSVVVGKAPS